jgi:hypothetical protein
VGQSSQRRGLAKEAGAHLAIVLSVLVVDEELDRDLAPQPPPARPCRSG